YPTSIELALYPAIQEDLIQLDTLILDSKSGVTGAGKGLSDNTHFPRTNEAFAPYKVANHRHTPEIEQMLSELAGREVKVTFVPHLLPVNRGIISTIYCKGKEPLDSERIHALYQTIYADEPFVRVLPLGQTADLKFVKYSNYCDLSIHVDTHTNTLILVSCIDNMVKGAAGQAVQNMNIMYQWEEESGLQSIAPSF
ncbi:MAG: N-acetyl-gamma-glutamyl-phosphate reductase, partial [Erysipelotrichaceae bacterium]|nr:N-acetyl-gamma-glutamyl-phosphate reductase [Erysipelotrichaceae bacterium]